MESMKLEEHLEEQKKPRIDNGQEEWRNASNTNESELSKSAKGNKDLANLPSRRHRKLPAELNCQIFYCLNLPTRRKFICGLGWDFYAMFRQILLKKSKRLCNPAKGNRLESNNMHVKVSEDGLNASNINRMRVILYAMEGFPISGEHCREDNFPGTICYYYEVKILKSASIFCCWLGLTDGEIPFGGGISEFEKNVWNLNEQIWIYLFI